MKRKLVALALLGGLLAAVPALATVAVGVSATTHARGTIADKVKIKEDKNTDFITQQITIAPGGHTGWHSHPGAVIVIVKSGTFAYVGVRSHDDDDDDDDGGRPRCFTRVYTAGQSFLDPGHGNVHIGRNIGTTPVELWATYTGVPIGALPRIDGPDLGC